MTYRIPNPRIEIINTGAELLLGQALNTHQQWLCRELSTHGYAVRRQVTVSDAQADIKEALGRADLVIVTGGLGPTSDDRTREAAADLLNRPLHEDPRTLLHIQGYFAARKRPMPEAVGVQAMIPQGAEVFPNSYGTAPGLGLRVAPNPFRTPETPSSLLMLPGPPRELYPLFQETIRPWLKRHFPTGPGAIRTFRTTGQGESTVAQCIEGPLRPLVARGLEIGYCAHPGEVEIRLQAKGRRAKTLVDAGEKSIRASLGPAVFGQGDDSLEAVLVELLRARGQTLAVAESCTGGLLAHRITNVPGASVVLKEGWVTYSNEAKRRSLKVRQMTLMRHGAVSEAVARQMAEGARIKTGADYALSVTGIAGPSGGTAEKPVGTVFIGMATAQKSIVRLHLNPYDRATFKRITTEQALNLLRFELLGIENAPPDPIADAERRTASDGSSRGFP